MAENNIEDIWEKLEGKTAGNKSKTESFENLIKPLMPIKKAKAKGKTVYCMNTDESKKKYRRKRLSSQREVSILVIYFSQRHVNYKNF